MRPFCVAISKITNVRPISFLPARFCAKERRHTPVAVELLKKKERKKTKTPLVYRIYRPRTLPQIVTRRHPRRKLSSRACSRAIPHLCKIAVKKRPSQGWYLNMQRRVFCRIYKYIHIYMYTRIHIHIYIDNNYIPAVGGRMTVRPFA